MGLQVVLATAEALPFAKVGGLADVAGALPRELARLGARVTLVMPAYRAIERARFDLRPVERVSGGTVPVGARLEPWRLESARMPDADVEVLFVGGSLFERDGIYTDPHTGRAFPDEAERWIFFCRAALAALRALGRRPDVLHLNDFHTALAAAYLRQPEAAAGLQGAASLLSIHNLGYQGLFDARLFPLTGLPAWYMAPLAPLEFWGRMNFMKAGLVLSDALSTVSPTYAREIQGSDEFGYGLQGVLRERSDDLFGILNGIDDGVWNPSLDPLIAARYDCGDPAPKETCKRALLERVGLPYEAHTPVFGCISRLADQKGFDLLLAALPRLLERGLQLVVLGSGQREYESALLGATREHPRQVSVTLTFDDALAHAIEAGCDFFLMPSRYEPCGLNQMYSLKYGTVPVVRQTGGLADTVQEWNPARREGNGFVFAPYTPEALRDAVERALAAFADPHSMRRLRLAGMGADFSWTRSARRYLDVYERAMARHLTRAR